MQTLVRMTKKKKMVVIMMTTMILMTLSPICSVKIYSPVYQECDAAKSQRGDNQTNGYHRHLGKHVGYNIKTRLQTHKNVFKKS